MSQATAKPSVKASTFREYKFALLLVATVGLVGSVYVLSSIKDKQEDSTQNTIILPREPSPTKSNILKIEGKKYTNEELSFTIKNFNDKLNYTINFGDEVTYDVNQAVILHKFDEAKSYPIKLKIEYQENVFLLDKQTLVIQSPTNSNVQP